MLDLEALVAAALPLVDRAGEAILAVYAQNDPAVTAKPDGSPLTDADRAAHAVLARGLAALTPDLPIVSEEGAPVTVAPGATYWLIDPLDGTREFLARNGDFTVNVALIERGIPVLGIVAAPVVRERWFGTARGAFARHGDDAARAIRAADYRTAPALLVAASRAHGLDELAPYLAALPPHAIVNRGSSLKFCLVAEGSAHLYARTGPTFPWDTAAGHAIVAAAGGRVEAFDGTPLRYDDPYERNPWFVARGDPPYPWPPGDAQR